MDIASLVSYLTTAVAALLGWWATRMQKDIDANRFENDELKADLARLELKVSEKGFSKEEFIRFETRLFTRLAEMDTIIRNINK